MNGLVARVLLNGYMSLNKKTWATFFSLLFLTFFSSSQNLVPNYSFDFDTACPSGTTEIYYAVPWINPNTGSSDYFNGCASLGSNVSVPNNFSGEQAANTGIGYAGIATKLGGDY